MSKDLYLYLIKYNSINHTTKYTSRIEMEIQHNNLLISYTVNFFSRSALHSTNDL